MYTMEDFKNGKISVWAETEDDAERFLRACEAAGLEKNRSPEREKMSYVYGWRGMPTNSIGWSDKKHYAQDNAYNGKPFTCITVAEFFGEQRRNEQIIAYYNPDGTVTCIHKKDGKIVQRETVKRYHKDADDLRVAAKCALEKMLGEQKQGKTETDTYHPGDRVLVRDDLVAGKMYGNDRVRIAMLCNCGKVIILGEKNSYGNFSYRGWWYTPEMLVGKIVHLDGLKAGDEVLVRSADFLGDCVQKRHADKVVLVDSFDCDGDAVCSGVCFDHNLQFYGKLIRVPSKG